MLTKSPVRKHRLSCLFIVIILLTVFQLLEQSMGGSGYESVFRYERALIDAGEYYRLVTAHLVHLNWMHLGLNLIGLAACYLLLDGTESGLALSMLMGILTISGGLFLFWPQVEWYAGYSGVLYGQVLYALLAGLRADWRRACTGRSLRHMLRMSLLGVAAAYLLVRVVAGLWMRDAAVANDTADDWLIGAPVLHEAHGLGAAAGMIAFALLCLRKTSQT